MTMERRRIRVRGTVQGVGYRPWLYRQAVGLGLAGEVRNDLSGVVIEAEGDGALVDELVRRVSSDGPPRASVRSVDIDVVALRGDTAFVIAPSRSSGAAMPAVPADVATCAACLAEIADPAARRFCYPFTACTDCGPRYTVIELVPYDRETTTMARFAMCDDCKAEHDDPGDRRFHAQALACPRCGPRLSYLAPSGAVVAADDDAMRRAVTELRDGRIVGVQGIGGFHVAALAASDDAVTELRRRKRREHKPLAVMVATVEDARAIVCVDDGAAALLAAPSGPIVVLPRIAGAPISDAVAPGLGEVGVMVAYSGLHRLLVEGVGSALVMTSGNATDEPIAHEVADAVRRLGALVDGLLTHDRAIRVPCDDSVIRWAGAGAIPVRRSRGFAPEAFALRVAGPPLLAVGAQLKSTVTVAANGLAVPSGHVGDLDNPAADAAFRRSVLHLCRLTGVIPELVAHDLHPDYRSTAYATSLDLPIEGVQHHHAHIASCLAEHGETGPVVGVAFDGLGLGTDGGLWGGEVFVADLRSAQRVGRLRDVALPGGDLAARQPWRMLVSWIDAVLGDAAVADIGPMLDDRWDAVHRLVRASTTPRTSSAGRLFDAVAALASVRAIATFEGQAAMELEAVAEGGDVLGGDGVEIVRDAEGLVMDPGPLLVSLLAARADGAAACDLSATFHDRLAAGVVDAVMHLTRDHDIGVAALSGGVFQNARLLGAVSAGLERAGVRVLRHAHVPANDGGISIGQAAIASARHAT